MIKVCVNAHCNEVVYHCEQTETRGRNCDMQLVPLTWKATSRNLQTTSFNRIYRTGERVSAPDLGYRDGYWWGQFWMLITVIVVAVVTYLLLPCPPFGKPPDISSSARDFIFSKISKSSNPSSVRIRSRCIFPGSSRSDCPGCAG